MAVRVTVLRLGAARTVTAGEEAAAGPAARFFSRVKRSPLPPASRRSTEATEARPTRREGAAPAPEAWAATEGPQRRRRGAPATAPPEPHSGFTRGAGGGAG